VSVIRYLTATAGCAVLLGLAVTGYVRAQLSDLEATVASMRPSGSAETSSDSSPSSQQSEVYTVASDRAPAESQARRQASSKAGAASSPSSSPRATGSKKLPTKSKGSAQAKHGSFVDQLDHGITKVGEGRYEIDRSTLNLALGNLALLSGSVRVAPDMRDGKPVGFRLFAIAADGPFAKLGLVDEDVLVSINHLSLTTVEQVLDAYGKLKTARHLMLGILRGGRKMSLEYTIR
jgi:hypothetical protein